MVFAKGMQNYTLFSFNQIIDLNKLIGVIQGKILLKKQSFIYTPNQKIYYKSGS